MKKSHLNKIFRRLLFIIGLCSVLLLMAGRIGVILAKTQGLQPDMTLEEPMMTSTPTSSITAPVKPAMDLSAPAHTETATFALG
jgi:hypothetical protein